MHSTTTIPDTLCYLNGEYQRLSEAKVSVLDRGFIFGDGIYEVVPVYGQKFFRFDEHLARLGRSLAKLRIENPHTREQWLEPPGPLKSRRRCRRRPRRARLQLDRSRHPRCRHRVPPLWPGTINVSGGRSPVPISMASASTVSERTPTLTPVPSFPNREITWFAL